MGAIATSQEDPADRFYVAPAGVKATSNLQAPATEVLEVWLSSGQGGTEGREVPLVAEAAEPEGIPEQEGMGVTILTLEHPAWQGWVAVRAVVGLGFLATGLQAAEGLVFLGKVQAV